jgi:hypothetical protein
VAALPGSTCGVSERMFHHVLLVLLMLLDLHNAQP